MAVGDGSHHVDAISGCFAGMCQVIVGHPFDTVKVRLQTGKASSISACVRSLGLPGLYRGVWSPLFGIGLCNSVLFHTYTTFRDTLGCPVAASGMIAGVAMGMVNCPVELLKVRLQTAPNLPKNSSIFQCVYNIVADHRHGVGMFRGLGMTLLRDAPSFAVYFAAYEGIKGQFDSGDGAAPIVAGACAGIAAWLPCYPQDVIKSVIQSSDKPTSIKHAARIVYVRQGLAGFFAGFVPTMLRAIPANAATFFAYETAKSFLRPK